MKIANFWLLAIFLISFVSSVLNITVPMDVDEGGWLYRGVMFVRYFFQGDLANTYITHHPGVTNMWLIGSSQFLNSLLYSLFPGWLNLDQPPLQHVCFNEPYAPPFCPISLYIIPRLVQALITSACMVGIYILAKRLLGQAVALVAMILLMLSPFFLAYQRYITTDALQTDFSILAVLLLLLYLRENSHRKILFLSALFMGLATASKIPSIFMLPGIVVWIVMIELGVWRTSFPQRGWIRQIFDLIIWGVIATAMIVVIWPAFWVAPLETWQKLQEGLLAESKRGAFFFLGQFTNSPSPLFYPLVLAYRLSPLLQVGLLAYLVTLLIPRLRHHLDKMPELAAIALIPLSVLFILSTIDSKIDRYIIPIVPELALLAGAGWLQIAASIKRYGKIRRRPKKEGIKTALTLAVAQLFLLVPHYPYYISYYNPLLGGSQVAKNLFMLGQGEGLDQAGRWLNQSPSVKEITAASWYSLAFGSYFHGRSLELEKFNPPNLSDLNWIKANRVVLYFNQLQRQLPEPKMLNYFSAQKPLYTVHVDGIDYVLVYPGPLPLPDDLKHIQFPLSLSFGEQLRLLGYDLISSGIKPGEELVVAFYWKFLQPMPPKSKISMTLRDVKGQVGQSSQTSLLNDYISLDKISSGTVMRDVHRLKTESDLQSRLYQIAIEWLVDDKEKVLELRDSKGTLKGNRAIIGDVDIVNF